MKTFVIKVSYGHITTFVYIPAIDGATAEQECKAEYANLYPHLQKTFEMMGYKSKQTFIPCEDWI